MPPTTILLILLRYYVFLLSIVSQDLYPPSPMYLNGKMRPRNYDKLMFPKLPYRAPSLAATVKRVNQAINYFYLLRSNRYLHDNTINT